METKEFNLLREPWIKVLTSSLSVQEISLTDALINAQSYKSLAGEMATQDFAMLRLLLACAQTIFYLYDSDGTENPIEEGEDPDNVLARWKEYWDQGHFPASAVRTYFQNYEERFWLFHPEMPFYQVADLSYGTEYGASCLFGNIKSSNHDTTKYHFSMTDGDEIQNISYGEAARWLLHLNGYGVNVKNNEKAPGTTKAAGVGHLGKLGSLYVDAKNLFELLMLNLTPLAPEGEAWAAPKPIWEQPIRTKQSIEIEPLDNLPELYTLQSRRILLKREENYVTGYRAMNGDFHNYVNDRTEQLTLWKKEEDKKTHIVTVSPKLHSAQIQAWREFPSFFNFSAKDNCYKPGIIQWISFLCNEFPEFEDKRLTFRTVGMTYGSYSYTYGDCISDGITLSSNLLRSLSQDWLTRISDEIEKCRRVENEAIRLFAKRVCTILNIADSKPTKNSISEKFYAEIDYPFRSWLSSINPETDKKEETLQRWELTASQYAQKAAKEYLDTLSSDLYRIRDTNKKEPLSIPGAYNEYLRRIQIIYPPADREKRKEEQNL